MSYSKCIKTLAIVILLMSVGQLHAATNIYVLGIPSRAAIIDNLMSINLAAKPYGPSNRSVADFNTIVLGTSVEPNVAIRVLQLVHKHENGIDRIILHSDADRSITKEGEITIASESLPRNVNIKNLYPLSTRDFDRLLKFRDSKKGLHRFIRSKYNGSGNAPAQTTDSVEKNVPYIAPGGLAVIPQTDGTAIILSSEGQRGTLLPGGTPAYYKQNLASSIPIRPVNGQTTRWTTDVESWLEHLSERTLDNISSLLNGDEESIRNLVAEEQRTASTVYEKLHFRTLFLGFLAEEI